jgi:NAD(P)-dependent dehydrogenase (short-subunit alcohol dehydrogenase family)
VPFEPTPTTPLSRPLVDLKGRVVVVTGGSAGIGLGIARGVVRAGGAVALWARRLDRAEQAAAELVDLGGTALAVACDVAEEAQVEAAMARTLERFGRLDALVANAGIGARRTPVTELSLTEWRSVLAVNLDGAFLSLRAGARQLIEQAEGGSLVAVSSTAAIHGPARQSPYAASKTALLGLVRSLAVELARHRIRVNALLPGWTETELTAPALADARFVAVTTQRTPVRRWATPADFEAVGAFLCHPAIAFHTGDTLVVDGGYTVF